MLYPACKEWGPLDIFPIEQGGSAAGLIDIKVLTTYSSKIIDFSSFRWFQLVVQNVQTGTPNAAVVLMKADFLSDDGSIVYASDVAIGQITVGVTTNTNQYTVCWSPEGVATVTKANGTSAGTISVAAGGGEAPTLYRAVGKIRLKANVTTASTATTSTFQCYLRAQT